jgi:CheY-like chemotaxis protein
LPLRTMRQLALSGVTYGSTNDGFPLRPGRCCRRFSEQFVSVLESRSAFGRWTGFSGPRTLRPLLATVLIRRSIIGGALLDTSAIGSTSAYKPKRTAAPRRFRTPIQCRVQFARERVVLVVEDDPELRTLYRITLRNAGYFVFAVDDGINALKYVEQTMPAAIVLDFGLPRLDGRDVQRELASNPKTKRIPIIVVTGQSAADINERDFACVLRKPLRAEDLVSAVEKCLDRR